MRTLPATGKRSSASQPNTTYFPLTGGEDMDSPALMVDPGKLSFSRNYECDLFGRYRRINGYEAFDGRPSPSDAQYWILDFDAGTAAFAVGDIATGHTSSAYGEVILQVLESGTYGTSDAAGYLVLTGVSGTFQDNEPLEDSTVHVALAAGIALVSGAVTDALHDTYQQAAIEAARDKIAVVPGTGSILGIWMYKGIKYAFRTNAGNTATDMYKSSTSGWTLVDIGKTLAFTSGGTYVIAVGNTITGATSSKTAVVTKVTVATGSWAGGDAAGTLWINTVSGAFVGENLNVGANPNVATIGGDATTITLVKDGTFRFCNANFLGSASTLKMYGVDGKNKAFEWDGTAFVQISTGMTTDTPILVRAHRNHLFLGYSGGSIQLSGLGTPYTWTPLTGAAELGSGDELTGMEVLPGPVLAIWSRNSIKMLYGSSSLNWEMKDYSLESGGLENTIQKLGSGIYLDDRGLTTLAAAQEFGDFKDGTISRPVQRFLQDMMASVACSVTIKERNQYRLYFTDKQGLCLTIANGKVLGFTRLLYQDQPTCAMSGENSSGIEEAFFGCDDGFVYQLDKGTSFNGVTLKSIARLHYNNLKSPSIQKRFRKLELEADAPVGTTVYAQVSFDYGMGENSAEALSLVNDQQVFDLITSGGLFGVSAWAEFVWGSPVIDTAEIKVTGSGRNFSCLFRSEGIYDEPHTLQGIIVHYDVRGLKR